ncbi:hypothetical protein QFC20_007020 [Naganishia adeliensis]|uniref:Uncharacterized protein n=1 Tax=Naganishia adeliensis TaxID=92952 RepID=A0ACC2V4C1_9TREE|nr:hypothetical protein QFC20_007020 [Naganishia adeliensis]
MDSNKRSGKQPVGRQDVVDEAEYAKALRATMHIKSPDRSRSGSAQLFGGQGGEDAELARAIAASLQEATSHDGGGQGSSNGLAGLAEDEMLAIAIAESQSAAQQATRRTNSKAVTESKSGNGKGKGKVPEVVIIDDSDSEEEQKSRSATSRPQPNAISTRNPASGPSNPDLTQPIAAAAPNPPNAPTAAPTSASPLLFDRLAMERERLERQKRLRGDVNAPASSSDDEDELQETEKKDERDGERDAKRRRLNGTTDVGPSASTGVQRDAPAVSQSAAGMIEPTWNAYAEGDTRKRFKIQDIIGDKEDLALIITASFCHEPEWIATHFPDPSLVPTIHIRQPPSAAENDRWAMETEETGGGLPGSAAVWAFMPSPGGYGSMHMKFMLRQLFYKTGRMRVVIASANLVSYDWEFIENIVFVQDLNPVDKKPKDPTVVTDDMPAKFQRLFERYMKIERALRHLKQFHPFGSAIPLDFIRNGQRSLATLGNWDWSRVTAEMVMSVPGKEIGEANCGRNGKSGLAACLRRRGWVPGKKQELVAEFQSSSLTDFTVNFMWNFYDCMRGRPAAVTAGTTRPTAKIYPPIKVLFPSLRTVLNSTRGPPGAGTMFCTDRHWNPKTRELFYDANCKAAKVMMHTKCILATFRPIGSSAPGNSVQNQFSKGVSAASANGAESKVGGWYYIGSHNFSSAAWGTMKMEGGQPQVFVKNYEMGIVLPLPAQDTEKAATEFATWQRPPRKYDRDSDKPWMQKQFGAILEQGPEAVNAEVMRYGM